MSIDGAQKIEAASNEEANRETQANQRFRRR